MKKLIFCIFFVLLFSGCANGQSSVQPPSDNDEGKVPSQEEENPQTEVEEDSDEDKVDEPDMNHDHQASLEKYLPPENVVKSFRGEGNEFAQEVESIFERQGNYLPTLVNNGGTQFLRIYEISSDGLYLVYEQPEFYEEVPPSLETLMAEFSRVEILSLPLEVGKVMNGWEVKAVDEKLTLPIGTIQEVLVLERQEESGGINRHYWAPDYGIVKKEYILKETDTEMIVTSELESMKNSTK